jgi:mRNA interferase RelE/StbE
LAWTIEFDEQGQRDLARLDKPIQREIMKYLDHRIAVSADPKLFGHALGHRLSGLWRYRVRDYRIVCRIEADRLVVLVVAIGHRSKVYKQ